MNCEDIPTVHSALKREYDRHDAPIIEFIQAQTGYMQGAAGVGSFLIHLATTLKGSPVKILFPEAPYGRLVR